MLTLAYLATSKKQKEIIDTLEKRISKISSELQEFPVEFRPSPKQIETIEESKQIMSSHLQESVFREPSALALTAGRDTSLTNTVDETFRTGGVVSCYANSSCTKNFFFSDWRQRRGKDSDDDDSD